MMSESTLNKSRGSDQASSRLQEDVESPKPGKVAIERYLEALRKSVMLSQ